MTITGSEIGSVSILKGNVANLPTLADGVMAVTEDTKKLYIGTATGNARVAMATQEARIAPTLLNGWVNYAQVYGNAGYYKDELGIVHLVGAVKSGTGIIFTLPAGYRPLATKEFAVSSYNGTTYTAAVVSVNSAGAVSMVLGSNFNLSLDGMNFLAEQ